MADLKHIQTFESFSLPVEEEIAQVETQVETQVEELNEGLFDGLKTKIDKYLKDPVEGKEDSLLKKSFSKSFANAPKVKEEILSLSHEDKIDILKKAAIKLSDPKIGVLKIIKRAGEWEVGGVQIKAGTGGGMRG